VQWSKTGTIGAICYQIATNFIPAGRGLTVGDQPFLLLVRICERG
jgi:hypothetical protein